MGLVAFTSQKSLKEVYSRWYDYYESGSGSMYDYYGSGSGSMYDYYGSGSFCGSGWWYDCLGSGSGSMGDLPRSIYDCPGWYDYCGSGSGSFDDLPRYGFAYGSGSGSMYDFLVGMTTMALDLVLTMALAGGM